MQHLPRNSERFGGMDDDAEVGRSRFTADRAAAGVVLAALAIMLIGLLTGCGPTPLTPENQAMFERARVDLEAGRLADAERHLSAVINASPNSTALSELYYLRGVARHKMKRYGDARADFHRGAATRGRRQTQVFSLVALANMDFEEANDASAIRLYRQALDADVSDLPRDQMLLRLAIALQRQGRWTEADDEFARLITEYPRSPLVAQARQKFEATAFTVQTGLFVDRKNAEAMAARLKRLGYPAGQAVAISDGRTVYVVNVGRFRTQAEAQQMAQRLQSAGFAGIIKP